MINFLKGLLFSVLVTSCLGAAPRSLQLNLHLDGRIIGGDDVNIEDLPYQLSLEYFGSHICGGAIISNDWLVTVAYCVDGVSASQLQIRAGSSIRGSGGSIHQASQIIMHPQFDYSPSDYDIAVVKVSSPFVYGTGVQAIPLTTTEPQAGDIAVASGWGTTSPGSFLPSELQIVELLIIDRTICNLFYGYLTENMICAGQPEGDKDVCLRDTGGPLAVDGNLVGIVSWGPGCGAENYPTVFMNIAALRDFVVSYTGVN